jgi:hypothetical protein
MLRASQRSVEKCLFYSTWGVGSSLQKGISQGKTQAISNFNLAKLSKSFSCPHVESISMIEALELISSRLNYRIVGRSYSESIMY